jgi:uncharacterized phage protein gp47/JayE
MAGLAHHTLRFIDWLALQLLPDTAETEWLDRHADIWLVNANTTIGRKMATYAAGTVNFTATFGGYPIPAGTQLVGINGNGYETTEEAVTADSQAPVAVATRALDPGTAGNQVAGTPLSVSPTISYSSTAEVVEMVGGTNTENDDDLRIRVLERIRQPPMGGDATDYIAWAKAVPGVTRAWCAPLEQGIGTVTVRFMMDDLRPEFQGFPTGADVMTVDAYLDTVRPVAVKEVYTVAPLPQRIDTHIIDLVPDTETIRAAIEDNLQAMLLREGAPGRTIYAAWKYHAIMDTVGVDHFDLLTCEDDPMPTPGHLAVLGDIIYGVSPSDVDSTSPISP